MTYSLIKLLQLELGIYIKQFLYEEVHVFL